MKNSIEEDIKNAEHFIKSIKTDKEYKEENGWHGYYNKEIVELARILQHILSDYKRILKENEELKKFHIQDNKHLDFIMENSITVQKVKDKIEELQKEYNKLDKQVDEYIKSVEKDVSTYYENKERISIMQTLSYFIDTLKELIEEREEK